MESIYNQPIVLVDDNKSNLLLMEIFLRDNGYTNLLFFQHAKDAYEHLKTNSCTLILLDLNMPDISGLEFMQILDNDPKLTRPAVMFVAAASDETILGECFDRGAIDFVRKPLDSGIELIARVTRALKSILKEAEIVQELHIDELSQLYNRRYFDEIFLNVYQKTTRRDRQFHLILLDIDNFKLYNDTYGHPAGDDVIRQISQSIKQSVHSLGDLVFRVGGEEFAALFCTSKTDNLNVTLDAICNDVEKLGIKHEHNKQGVVTISGGHLSVTDKNHTFNALYEACDKLLYEAKHHGKNHVVHKKV